MQRDKRTDYKRSFNEKTYDRLGITIPKGQKPAVQAAADSEGAIHQWVHKQGAAGTHGACGMARKDGGTVP